MVDVFVEVDVAGGLPGMMIVGLPDTAVQESRERVRSAVRNAGLPFPATRIVVLTDDRHGVRELRGAELALEQQGRPGQGRLGAAQGRREGARRDWRAQVEAVAPGQALGAARARPHLALRRRLRSRVHRVHRFAGARGASRGRSRR